MILSLFNGGCVNPNMTKLQDSSITASPAPPLPSRQPRALEASPAQDSYRETDSGKRYSLTLKEAELRDVLMMLSRESNVTIVADRDVEGRVTVNLSNKKLGEILYTILKPLDLTARVENGIIIVGRPAMITRTFQINYLKDKRDTTSNTSSGGGVKIATSGSTDFWPAIESALEVLIFGTSGKGSHSGSGYIRGDIETRKINETEGGASKQANSSLTIGAGKEQSDAEVQAGNRQQTTAFERQDIKTKRQLIVNELAGIVQVTDYSDNIDKISSFLSDIEPAIKRQVMIQAHIIEVSLSDGFSLGLNWRAIADKATNLSLSQALMPVTAFTGTAAIPVPVPLNQNSFTISGGNTDFSLLLDAMKDQGQVKILSSPKISALNNQKAVIKLTTQEVSWDFKTKDTSVGNTTNTNSGYESKVIEVGIFLDVTPQISEDGTITMQVHPSISEVKSVSVSPDNKSTMPIIDTREIDTTATAKSGDTIVIAGLIVDKLRESKRSIPFLGDIPYAGALFSSSTMLRSKTELVIMLTPYFLNEKSIAEIRKEHERRLQNISGDFHLINNLGSMITEKSSRDWIMKSEPHRVQPATELKNKSDQSKGTAAYPMAQPDVPLTIPSTLALPETKVVPHQDSKDQVEPAQIISIPSPETKRQLEQQQTTIMRLENEVAAVQQQLTLEKQQNNAISPKNITVFEESNQPPLKKAELLSASVQTTTATTDREQTLYRSAVIAYKTGDCKESIKSFDRFLTMYPDSPFAQDAAYYRKDCADHR